MLRRSRPLAALCAAVLLSGLAACGSESDSGDEATGSSGSAAGLEEVSFTGEVGESLTAEWSGAIEQPEETRVETLVEGGDLATGETVGDLLDS